MDSANPGWKRLLERPLLIPAYLLEPAEQLCALAEPLSQIVGEFLQAEAKPLDPKVRREAISTHDPSRGSAFDSHYIMGDLSVRILVPSDTVDALCPILFGGPVSETALRNAAGQGIAVKMAETVLLETGQSTNAPTLKTPGEEPLSDEPLLCIDFGFDLGERGEMSFTIGFTRQFTDLMAAPPSTVPQSLVMNSQFEALAIVTEQRIALREMTAWEPGSIVSLKKASTERVSLTAFGKETKATVALGELGADDGVKCLRLTHVGLDEVASAMPAAASGAATFAAGPDGPESHDAPSADPLPDLQFAMANPLEEDSAEEDGIGEIAMNFATVDPNEGTDDDADPQMAVGE